MYNEETDVTIEDLKKTISNFAITDSITVYNSLEKKGVGNLILYFHWSNSFY